METGLRAGFFLRHMLVPEGQREDNTQRQRIGGKDKPDACPVLYAIHRKVIHHPAAADATQKSAQPIGHDHEQSLCAGPDGNRRLPLDE